MYSDAKIMAQCALAVGVLASPPALAQTWQPLCNEGVTCTFEGTRPLRFGTGDRHYYGVATATVSCSAAVFGDPAPGEPKSCEAYYTAFESSYYKSLEQSQARVQELEDQNAALQAELEEAATDFQELQRAVRRDQRRGIRVLREQR